MNAYSTFVRSAAMLVSALTMGLSMVSIQAQEVNFTESEIYFELNDTDGDLGIHGSIDGDAWRDLRIRDAGGKLIGNVRAWGTMVKQGFTQLFFESAEPSFDELDPADFFARFPEGEYRIDGWGNQGGRMHASSLIRHVMPAPPGGITVSGLPKAPTCDEEDPDYDAALVPTVSAGNPVIVDWAPVISSHPTIGIVGDIEVERYEFFVETDTEVGGEEFTAKLAMILPPDATEMMVPEELLGLGEQFKYEILVREREGGNQTAIESCFFLVRN